MFERLIASVQALLERDPFRERRLVVRVPQKLPVECFRGTVFFEGIVVDIGTGGILMETDEKLQIGQAVDVRSVVHHPALEVQCTVQWTRARSGGPHLAGLKFSGDLDAPGQTWVHVALKEIGLAPDSARQRRRTFRVATNIPAEVKSLAGELLAQATVLDLGTGGATICGSTTLPGTPHILLCIGPLKSLAVLTVKGRILAERHDAERQEVYHHLSFVDLAPKDSRAVRHYMRRVLRDAAESARD